MANGGQRQSYGMRFIAQVWDICLVVACGVKQQQDAELKGAELNCLGSGLWSSRDCSRARPLPAALSFSLAVVELLELRRQDGAYA